MPKTLEEKCSCNSDDYEDLDPFGVGNLTDTHIDMLLTEDELAQRLYDVVENAKRMGGDISSAIELGVAELIAPKMTWEDFVSIQMGTKKNGGSRNDWSIPKSRSLFSGLYLPKKRSPYFKLLILIDRSGSVSDEQAAYGISQFQSISNNIEGYAVCFDTKPYYEHMTILESAEPSELLKIKQVGGGGTAISSSLYSYLDEIGEVDMVAIITDGYIFDMNEVNAKGIPDPKSQVIWILNENNPSFKPSFGRVFNLKNV